MEDNLYVREWKNVGSFSIIYTTKPPVFGTEDTESFLISVLTACRKTKPLYDNWIKHTRQRQIIQRKCILSTCINHMISWGLKLIQRTSFLKAHDNEGDKELPKHMGEICIWCIALFYTNKFDGMSKTHHWTCNTTVLVWLGKVTSAIKTRDTKTVLSGISYEKKMCRVIASTLGITLIWWKSQKLFLRFQIKMYFCVWNRNTSFNSILSIWIFLICYYFRKQLCAYIFWNSLERWKSICYAA